MGDRFSELDNMLPNIFAVLHHLVMMQHHLILQPRMDGKVFQASLLFSGLNVLQFGVQPYFK